MDTRAAQGIVKIFHVVREVGVACKIFLHKSDAAANVAHRIFRAGSAVIINGLNVACVVHERTDKTQVDFLFRKDFAVHRRAVHQPRHCQKC